MRKRLSAGIGVLSLLLAASLGVAAVLARGHGVGLRRGLSHVRRGLSHVLSGARAYAAPAPLPNQAVVARDPGFLKPQRLDAWQIIGPGGGGTFHNVAVSPHDPNLVFASTDMAACYVSENGGRTWRTFNLRVTCKFVFDPKLPNRVYAIANALWRSDDRGHTWSLVYPDSSTEVIYVDDEAEVYHHNSTGYPLAVVAMTVDPDDSNTLYTSVAEERMLVSKDAGKSWKILTMDAFAPQIWIDPTSPPNKRTIYTRRGNLIGTWDGAKYVKRAITGVDSVAWAAFGIPSGGGKPVIYVVGDYVIKDGKQQGGGVMVSNDGGQTWRSLNDNLLKLVAEGTFPNFSTIAANPKHADVLYVSYTNFILNDKKVYYGVLKSLDGGTTWTNVRQESSIAAENMHNDWISRRFGPDWGDEPLDIAMDENNPDLVYTTDLGRIMRSVDGGKNWVGVFSQSTGKGYTTTGLDVTTSYGVHFDPFDSKRMFISYTDIGLMRSEDGGESWLSATTGGVPRAWLNTTYWVEFDPAVKGKMWAVMSSRHDLPRRRMLNLYGGPGGLVESVDGGHTWKVVTGGLPSAITPTHILLDPKSPVSARVLYLTAFGRGIYKSTDGGQNWAPKNAGLPEKAPLTWRMAMAGDGTLYVVTIRQSQDGKYGNDQDGMLFCSRNGAESWERVTLPAGVNGPVGITVDPRDPARMYLAAWGRYTLYVIAPPPAGGVYMSTDSGQNWKNVLSVGQRIYDVTVDPRNSDLVYATGFDASAWRSVDRAKTWRRLGGFNFKDGHRVIPDPEDIDKIYITTFGNSVWHGPAAGDPQALEDIISPSAWKFQSVRK